MSIFSGELLDICRQIRRAAFGQPCLLCGINDADELVCQACRDDLPWLALAACCPRCAIPTPDGATCGRCLAKPPVFDCACAAFEYRYPVTELVHAFKYSGNFTAGSLLAASLADRLKTERMPEWIVPMPLHPTRLKERGFNQAAELGRRLSLVTGAELRLDILVKMRDTAPQASLPWRERQANVKGAFACRSAVAGRRIALVDDVMTTGATLREAAKIVRNAGAADISVWVAARTPQGEPRRAA